MFAFRRVSKAKNAYFMFVRCACVHFPGRTEGALRLRGPHAEHAGADALAVHARAAVRERGPPPRGPERARAKLVPDLRR